MPRFQFSLHRLLDLRQLELQQLEMRAAAEGQQAAAARRLANHCIEQLAVEGSVKENDWFILQQESDGLRQQAHLANQVAAIHQHNQQLFLAACAEKRQQVEALESLQESEHQEFRRRQSRRDEAAMQEQILRKWQTEKRQASRQNQTNPRIGQ